MFTRIFSIQDHIPLRTHDYKNEIQTNVSIMSAVVQLNVPIKFHIRKEAIEIAVERH